MTDIDDELAELLRGLRSQHEILPFINRLIRISLFFRCS